MEKRVAARTRELELANESLKNLAAEREMLLVEVNHRAKNSLAVASALLGIQALRQTNQAVQVLFKEAQDRIHAMARVHDLLSRSEASQRVDVAVYMADLCEGLRSLMENAGRVRLEANVEVGILVNADTAVPLGIVLTELITNAVKYAFPAPMSGTILAQARRGQPGWVQIIVRDDGVGISDPRGGSLGCGLVRSLVRQIRGEIDIQGNDGVTVTISLPEHPPR